jgi:hypothetical protein
MSITRIHARKPRLMRSIVLVVCLTCLTIYLYPLISSTLTWLAHRSIIYEGKTKITVPFRWSPTTGGGLVLTKPDVILVPYSESVLSITDSGSFYSDRSGDAAAMKALKGIYGGSSNGSNDRKSSPFRAAGVACGPVGESPVSPLITVFCTSSNLRYQFSFMGREADVSSAADIVRQIAR